jgi:hypothetical protein
MSGLCPGELANKMQEVPFILYTRDKTCCLILTLSF